MPEFNGYKKDKLAAIKRAVTMHERMTGEHIDISDLPEQNDEEDLKAKQEKDRLSLERQADINRQLENAQQAARRIARGRFSDESQIQPENPGPMQPALVTERAKEQGVSRKGTEPDTVTGREGSQNAAPGTTESPVSGSNAPKPEHAAPKPPTPPAPAK